MRNAIAWAGPAAVPVLLMLALAATFRLGAPPAAGTKADRPRFKALVAEAKQRTPTLDARALKARLDAGDRGFLLIDVREDGEWAAGRIPGAVHLSRGVLEGKIEGAAPDPNARLVLYCESGARAALAAVNLRRMGYTNVLSLEGGMRAWLAAGGPTVNK